MPKAQMNEQINRSGLTTMAVMLLALFLLGATIGKGRSTGVTIRDDKFQVIHVLNGKKAVAAFNKHWRHKKKVSASSISPHWLYKIDLPDATRWLYDPAGYTQLLSQHKRPIYRIQSVNSFNKLIGIKKTPPP